jgi:phospholipid/cholesterol/gamma-HCH transport system ATP-binding protein
MTDVIDNLIIKTQKKLGVTCVVISHDSEAAFKVADNVAMLHDGKIVIFGDAQTVKESQNPIFRQFVEGKAEGPIKII